MNAIGRTFEPTGRTQNSGAMDGTAKTVTLPGKLSDLDGAVHLYVKGTEDIFVTLDGVTPTTTNALPLAAGSTQTLSMPAGKLAIKAIGAAGSTLYVTPGRGV
jgi:hypothetical protein